MDSQGPRTMVLIGKTGHGKSATCNSLLCSDKFKSEPGGVSVTAACQLERNTAWGRDLTVIDTPGTLDVKDPEQALQELTKAIDQCSEGIDAFLLVFRCDVRATEEELKAADDALSAFGPECDRRAIIVFTRTDEFDNDRSKFMEKLRQIRSEVTKFNDLLSKLGDRWVMLDNSKRCEKNVREQQVTDLLKLVDQVALNNPRRYKKADQQEAQKQKEMVMKMQADYEKKLAAYRLESLETQLKEKYEMMQKFAELQLHAREFGQTMLLRDMQMELARGRNNGGCALM